MREKTGDYNDAHRVTLEMIAALNPGTWNEAIQAALREIWRLTDVRKGAPLRCSESMCEGEVLYGTFGPTCGAHSRTRRQTTWER